MVVSLLFHVKYGLSTDKNRTRLCMSFMTRGPYCKALQIHNVQRIDRFHNKLVPYFVDLKHANFDKHTLLLQNL